MAAIKQLIFGRFELKNICIKKSAARATDYQVTQAMAIAIKRQPIEYQRGCLFLGMMPKRTTPIKQKEKASPRPKILTKIILNTV